MPKAAPLISWLVNRIQSMQRIPRPLVWLVQAGIFAASGLAAFLIRFDFTIPAVHLRHLIWALLIWLVVKPVVFRLCGLDGGWWCFVSIHDVSRLGAGNLCGSLAGAVLLLSLAPSGFPRSIFLLDLLICLLATTGVRVVTRIVQDSLHHPGGSVGERRVIIYGAGAAGVSLLREIRASANLRYHVLGFVDDNPRKSGVAIQGVKVIGGGDALSALAPTHKVEEILIALPSATGREMTAILSRCHHAGIRCRTIPALAEIIEGRALATQIRDVAVEDLLGRKPVRLEERQILDSLEGKIVLVTGVAGSIGSELARQIARFHPAGIVGFDAAESPLFEIDRELRQSFPHIPFYAEIGSIQHCARLDEVFGHYRPAVVYHAAAYKHVPLMEAHVFEAVENNIFGTYNVAMAAAGHGADDFVMISSDKAVRPTNIMGATKRVAEQILLALQNGRTKFVAVRFGNVLGSNGSVIPIFKKQIAAGGPVTVTHPEMRRFFMTIPEACQLVLQAAAIGRGGQICVLDMGEPVKIIDLARNLILLSGLKPDEDIKIEFTGMRPGEKLYEEFTTLLEDTMPTAHEKIHIFVGNGMPETDILTWLGCLRDSCEKRDVGRLVVALKEIVLDYSPGVHVLKRLVAAQTARTLVTAV